MARLLVLRRRLRRACLRRAPGRPALQARIATAAKAEDIAVHRGGTYVCIDGPQFSSLAESRAYKAQGFDVIGMTNMPEAKLAREAEITYATIAMVTDYDCWHPGHDAVDVAAVIASPGPTPTRRPAWWRGSPATSGRA